MKLPVPPEEMEKVCPRCGRQCSPAARFCGGCAFKFPAEGNADTDGGAAAAGGAVAGAAAAAPDPAGSGSSSTAPGGVPYPPAPGSPPVGAAPVAYPTTVIPAGQAPPLATRTAKNGLAGMLRGLQLTRAAGWSALAGAGGGWLGHKMSGLFIPLSLHGSLHTEQPIGTMLLGQSLMGMWDCLGIAALLLITTNLQSLRGAWSRDLLRGLPLFAAFGLLSGFGGQMVFSLLGGTRAVPWALSGVVVGMTIGRLRRDPVQAKQGALGGAIGGVLGGLMVDAFLAVSYTDISFALGTRVGLIITGALMGFFMQAVQASLKKAWLTGVTTGFYEGKQFLLSKDRVTVGQSEIDDISLFRKSELRVQRGAFVRQGAQWFWQGEPVEINGVPQSDVLLNSGDVLKLGNTCFRFMLRDG